MTKQIATFSSEAAEQSFRYDHKDPSLETPKSDMSFAIQMSRFEELASLYDLVSSPNEISEAEKSAIFEEVSRATVAYTVDVSARDITDRDFKLPLTPKMEEYLKEVEGLEPTKRNLGIIAATGLLALSKGESAESVKQTMEKKHAEYEEVYESGLTKDISRNIRNLVIKKDGKEYSPKDPGKYADLTEEAQHLIEVAQIIAEEKEKGSSKEAILERLMSRGTSDELLPSLNLGMMIVNLDEGEKLDKRRAVDQLSAIKLQDKKKDSFKEKNKEELVDIFIDVLEKAKNKEPITASRVVIESVSKDLKKLSDDNDLGLTNEQITYTLRSMDQASTTGVGSHITSLGSMEQGFIITPNGNEGENSNIAILLDLEDGKSNLSISSKRFIRSTLEPEKVLDSISYETSCDISELRSERAARVGLGSKKVHFKCKVETSLPDLDLSYDPRLTYKGIEGSTIEAEAIIKAAKIIASGKGSTKDAVAERLMSELGVSTETKPAMIIGMAALNTNGTNLTKESVLDTIGILGASEETKETYADIFLDNFNRESAKIERQTELSRGRETKEVTSRSFADILRSLVGLPSTTTTFPPTSKASDKKGRSI